MAEAAITPDLIVLFVLLVLIVVPGYQDRPAPERPKKGFWQARDVLWPIGRTLRGLWPANPEFLKGYRGALFWAWFAAATANVAAKAMTPTWLTVEFVVIGILFGRAWGFWSADRRLQKIKAAQETADMPS